MGDARSFARHQSGRLLAGALVAACALAAVGLYFALAARHTSDPSARSPGSHMNATAAGASAQEPAQSMQSAIAGLESRLALRGGSDADWDLLARAYDFLGRADDANRARTHVANAAPAGGPINQMSAAALVAAADAAGRAAGAQVDASPSTAAIPAPAASLADLERRARAQPGDVPAWLALADAYRSAHDHRAARAALEKVLMLHGMTAQSWADYADVLASLAGGSLASSGVRAAIDQALALDARNAKALWLRASLAHEEHRYSDALSSWHALRTVLPGDSPDTRIIDDNIAEDTQLGGEAAVGPMTGGAAPQAPLSASAVNTGLSGTVALDARLSGRVAPGTTLFIFARAAGLPGPPLAVLRTTTGAWPLSFRLDDSMAMIPSRRLSQFDKVVVEARISRNGQASASAGDLEGASAVVTPGSGRKLALIINREIG
ncbi:MAG: hypothetical protein JSR67_04315 [Proteobacteria bacterium]|nr:hypothetical protein [Pseudomonadota bacterium]